MKEFDRLIEIIDILRSDKGCAWDKSRKLKDLRSCLLEETYELLDALEENDQEKIKEELGDVFLLLVFIIRMFKEKEQFEAGEVLDKINQKLIVRHPHVFAGKKLQGKEEITAHWVKAKAREKKRVNLSHRLPKKAPALLLASLLYKELRYLGEKDIAEKSLQKIGDCVKALDQGDQEGAVLADLVFECAGLASSSGIDLESDLRRKVYLRAENINYQAGPEKTEKREKAMKVDDVKKKVDRIWSESKKDVEKMVDEISRMVKKGEVHVKGASEKSRVKLEEVGLSLKKEKLCYELGKALIEVPRSRWAQNKKVNSLFDEARAIDRILRKKKKSK